MAVKLFTLAQVSVASAGTRVQVSATSTPVSTIIFAAPAANTGKIYIGDSDVSATRYAFEVSPGAAAAISADYAGGSGEEFILSDFYVDAATSGDDLNVSYVKRR